MLQLTAINGTRHTESELSLPHHQAQQPAQHEAQDVVPQDGYDLWLAATTDSRESPAGTARQAVPTRHGRGLGGARGASVSCRGVWKGLLLANMGNPSYLASLLPPVVNQLQFRSLGLFITINC